MLRTYLRYGILFALFISVTTEAGDIKCTLLFVKGGSSYIGSKVNLTLRYQADSQPIEAIFLGRVGTGYDGPKFYFLDRAEGRMVLAYEDDIDWQDFAQLPATVNIHLQSGPTCAAHSFLNCVDYLAETQSSINTRLQWGKETRANVLKKSIETLTAPRGGYEVQNAIMLKYLRDSGIGGKLADKYQQISSHLQTGMPAIFAVTVEMVPLEKMVRWQAGQFRPLTDTIENIPYPTDSLHYVIALSYVSDPGGSYYIIADSATGRLAVWSAEDTHSFMKSAILVGP